MWADAEPTDKGAEKNTWGETEYKHVIVCYGSPPMWAVNTTVSIYIQHKDKLPKWYEADFFVNWTYSGSFCSCDSSFKRKEAV